MLLHFFPVGVYNRKIVIVMERLLIRHLILILSTNDGIIHHEVSDRLEHVNGWISTFKVPSLTKLHFGEP